MSAWRILVRLAHARELAATGMHSARAYALLDRAESGGTLGDLSAEQAAILEHYLEAVAE